MRRQISREIYDIVSNSTISLTCQEAMSLGIGKFTWFSFIYSDNPLKVLLNRYCKVSAKDVLCKTLVDISTGKEFKVFSGLTLFYYMDVPESQKERCRDAVAKVLNKRTVFSSVMDTCVCLKENMGKASMSNLINLRNKSLFPEKLEQSKRQKQIRTRIATRIVEAVRKSISQKKSGTIDLLGCKMDFFMTYIESKFLQGMTWENYGRGNDKWHLDHIEPCNIFDLTQESDQRRCFHYTNLRPLWQFDNLSRPKDGSDLFLDFGINI